MAKAQRQLDDSLKTLIGERLEGDEIILRWFEHRPGEVTVQLISQKLHAACTGRHAVSQRRRVRTAADVHPAGRPVDVSGYWRLDLLSRFADCGGCGHPIVAS